MARPKVNDILSALDRIYTHQERKDQREQDYSMQMMRMQMQKDAREDTQDFQREVAREGWNRDFKQQHPGAILQDDGYYGLPDNYDYTQSTAYRTNNAIANVSQLRELGLPSDGTDDENSKTLAAYMKARNVSANTVLPTISEDASFKMGGDMTPNHFTSSDIADFEALYEGSGGADSPIALQQLVDAKIVSEDILQRQDGFLVADDKAKELINVSFQGLKQGALANKSYMDQQAFEAYTDKQRQDNMLFAQNLTSHPYIAEATNIFNSTKSSIGSKFIASNQNEGGEMTMLWNGTQARVSDIHELTRQEKGIYANDSEREAFQALTTQLSSVTSDGAGLEAAIQTLQTRPALLKIVRHFSPGLAKSLQTAQKQFGRIQNISQKVSSFIDSPGGANQKMPVFREFIQKTGLPKMMVELRRMQVEGEDVGKIKGEIGSLIKSIRSQMTDVQSRDKFQQWLMLEATTAELFQESASKRRSK